MQLQLRARSRSCPTSPVVAALPRIYNIAVMSQISASDLPTRCGLAATNLTDARRPDLDPEEELASTFDCITLMIGLETQGEGQLFVTSRRMIWAGASTAFGVQFTSLIMHAVASASEEFPHDSIYLQLDGAEVFDDDREDSSPQVRLVSSQESVVSSIFQALCDGAVANPDSDVEDDEGDFFFDQDEINRGAAQANNNSHADMLNRFDAMLQMPGDQAVSSDPQQFDDADSSSDDGHAGCPCHPRR